MESMERLASMLFRKGQLTQAVYNHQEALKIALALQLDADAQRLQAKVESAWNAMATVEMSADAIAQRARHTVETHVVDAMASMEVGSPVRAEENPYVDPMDAVPRQDK